MSNMTAWQFLRDLHEVCKFSSRDRSGKATNSELKRWLMQQSVQLNGKRIRWDEEVNFPVNELILFPKKRRTTIL